jgi:hypothetical protein
MSLLFFSDVPFFSLGVFLCYFSLHMAVYPPSTGNPTPVIQLQSSEARNTAVRAISSGSPRPRKGCIFSSFVRNSGSAKTLAVIAVPTSVFCQSTLAKTKAVERGYLQPGQIALQWIRYGAQSQAIAFVMPITACFEAQYPAVLNSSTLASF